MPNQSKLPLEMNTRTCTDNCEPQLKRPESRVTGCSTDGQAIGSIAATWRQTGSRLNGIAAKTDAELLTGITRR